MTCPLARKAKRSVGFGIGFHLDPTFGLNEHSELESHKHWIYKSHGVVGILPDFIGIIYNSISKYVKTFVL